MAKPSEVLRKKREDYKHLFETKRQQGRLFYTQKKQGAEQLYQRYEKYFPLAAFIIGFIWDSLTLTRIDSQTDNFILLGYTIAAGALIAVIGLVEKARIRQHWILTHLHWITGLTHFFLGGLLSSYVVFYFKSAAVGKSFIFIALLVGLMLANEFFSGRLRNLKLLCAIYFFCCFAFLTFFLPVLTHVMSDMMFLSCGALSFLITSVIVAIIYHGGIREARRELVGMAWPPAIIFLSLVLFYFMNWMPPVPLALKDGKIYRSVKKAGDNYEVRYSKPRVWQFWKTDDRNFAYVPGDTVYCYTAVFSPVGLKESIVQHWQKENPAGDWETIGQPHSNLIRRPGREGGWRSFSYKKNITPGDWRVEVKTAKGRLLGRISLEITAVDKRPTEMVIEQR